MIKALSGERLRLARAGTLFVLGILLTASPAASQVVTDPSECQGPERSEAELRRLLETPVMTRSASPPVGVPSGTPVDLDTARAIEDVTREFVACLNAGGPLRWLSLFSEAWLKDVLTPETLLARPPATPVPVEERATLLGIWHIQAINDGRVVATVARGGVDDPHPAPGRTSYFFFVLEDGEWRIDEMASEIVVDGQWVFVADLEGPPPGTPYPQ